MSIWSDLLDWLGIGRAKPPVTPVPDPETAGRGLVAEINAVRVARGLGMLVRVEPLGTTAYGQVGYCVERGVLTHDNPLGDIGVRARFMGYGGSWVGECLEYGLPTPHAVVAAWMADRKHKDILLWPAARHFGGAMLLDRSGRPYWGAVLGAP